MKPFILLPPRQSFRLVVTRALVSEYGTGPGDGAMEDGLLTSLAISIPISMGVSVCVW